MAEALGFDPPAGLVEQAPQEEVLPLEDVPGDDVASDEVSDAGRK
jgi:hypothetical protein